MSVADLTEAIAIVEHTGTKQPNDLKCASPADLRGLCRSGVHRSPTVGLCAGRVQANLVVLPQKYAYDFLLFCTRNRQSCPLLHVCDAGDPLVGPLAPGADLRTDLPGYMVYRHGKAVEQRTEILDLWKQDSVAFLIGCSFTCDGAFEKRRLPLRAAESGKNVPMYKTNIPVTPAGIFSSGTVVASMKPVPSTRIAEAVRLTSRYPHAHGAPLAVASGASIGIADIYSPDFGDAPEPLVGDDIPVFHACGVTPQCVLMACGENIPLAMTHAPGCMLVMDVLAEDSEEYIQ